MAEAALAPYYDAGMLAVPFEDFKVEALPMLRYDSLSSETTGIFWSVNLELSDESQKIGMVIDDQTGKLLIMGYDCVDNIFEKESFDALLEIFSGIYFSQVDLMNDLEEQNILNESDAAMEENEEVYKEKNKSKDYQSIAFDCGNKLNGYVTVVFNVQENGFYNYFE